VAEIREFSGNGREGAELLLTGEFHAALLDIYLPELNGFEVLQRVRSSACTTPILVLTAVDAVPKIVQAFDLGADDYLVKPFILEILLARISAIARRIGVAQPRLVSPSSLALDRSRRLAIRNGREVALTRKQYDLLEILIRHKGLITTREQLIEAGWGPGAEVRENTLEVYIHGLRSKLEDLHEKDQVVLRTVHGAGYMLVLDPSDVTQ